MFLKPNDHYDHTSTIALPSVIKKWVDAMILYAKGKLKIKTERTEDQLRLSRGLLLVLSLLRSQPIRGEDREVQQPMRNAKKSHERGFDAIKDSLFHTL